MRENKDNLGVDDKLLQKSEHTFINSMYLTHVLTYFSSFPGKFPCFYVLM